MAFFLYSNAYAQSSFSVNNAGADAICASAWPTEILGNYVQNGTNNGKPCYQGPNGYWLYHADMNVGIGASWIVGYPLGSNDVNGANVRFYITSSAATPPTGVNYTKTPNGCGLMQVGSGGATPPPTPTLNNPYNVTGSSMDLSWSQSAGATGYKVYLSNNSTFTAPVAGYNPKDVPKTADDPYAPTSTSASGLSKGTTYYVRVKAYSGAGDSGNSNTVSTTTIPDAPTANDASEILDQTFKANWSTASGATSYKLYVSTNSSFSSHITGYNGYSTSSTNHVVTGVSPSTTYYYRLKAYNSAGESGYSGSKTVATAAPMPEMNLSGNGSSISDGDSSPSTADHTDFGSVDVSSGSVAHTFTISNSGLGTLNLTGASPYVSITGHTSDFTLTTTPSSSIASGGGTTTFEVTFNPTTSGTRSATISIANDDSNENPYNFSVQGTGLVPEINVKGNGNNIADEDTTPATTDHTNFGETSVSGGSVVRTFTIENSGSGTLTLGANAVSLSGANAADYSVTTQPATTVASGGSTTFQVTFQPAATGTRSATISIANDDTNESPYNFSIQGTGTLNISINDVAVNENDGTATFTISLSQTYSSNITVDYATADNTATTGDSDYTSASGTATINSGSLSTTVSVTINNDTHYETNESFYVNITNANFGDISDSQGAGTINNDDSQPSVTLGLTNSPLAENGGIATLTATLSNRSYQNVTADLGYTGTATGGGTDYSAAASITINSGSLSNTTNITGVDDALSEGDESVIVDISSVTNGTEDGTQQVTASITDDDLAITINDASIGEDEGPAVFTITLSRTHTSDITIDYATADNTATTADGDYSSTSGTATITSGQLTTTVSVPVTNDTHYEAGETFYLNLSNASYGGISDAQGVATINNDDSQPSVTLGLTNSPLAEDGGAATLTATLSNRSYQNVTVNFGYTGTATGGGTDYSSSASITINAGSLSNTATVTGVNDLLDENDETVIVDISGVTNGSENGTQQVTATITDDDDPTSITVNDPTVTEGDGAAVNLNFTITLYEISGKTITVDYATSAGTATAGTDYTSITTSTLTFNPGDVSKTVTVEIAGDLIDEANETLYLNLSNSTNATIADTQGLGTITDNDPLPGLSVNDVTVTEGNSGTDDAVFTVTLSAVSGKTVTVDYTTANNTAASGSDYTSISNTLTFNPGVTAQQITVTVNGDVLDEEDETYYINLSGASNANISDTQGIGTITDDDGAPTVTLSLTGSPFDESGGTATVTATLSAESGKTATVNLGFSGTATNITDYTRSNTSITINAGSTTGSITLTGVNESDDDDNETVIVDMTGGTNCTENGTQQVTAVITDDENPEINLSGNGNNIIDGDDSPSLADNTDFGNVDLTAGDATHTFTISNTGSGALHISGSDPFITITGHTSDFTVTSAPATTVAKSGGITSFDIYFNPTTAGLREATVIIANDDPDESPFTFDIQGTGGNFPEIKVEYAGTEIIDGDATPATAEGTDFGLDHFNVSEYSPVHTFTIVNLGAGQLTLSSTPRVSVVGTDFSLVQDAPSVIAAGASAEFKVKFEATDVVVRNGTVSITNDDGNETPFNFSVTGSGYNGSLMIVEGGSPSVDIDNGDATPSASDYTDFGGTTLIGGTIDRTFVIENYGLDDLNLSGTPRVVIAGADAADFTLITPPPLSVESGDTENFTIRFDPTTSGIKTATVSIANDDPNRNPYTFAISGVGISREINVKQGLVDIADGGSYDFGNQFRNTNTDVIFTIENNGSDDMNLTGTPVVNIIGANADQFSVQTEPATPVGASGSTTYTIRFNPTALGNKTAEIVIANDDYDENPYNITLNGNGVNNPPVLAGIEAEPAQFTENSYGTQITNSITVTDLDDADIQSGVVQITGNYQNGEDILLFDGSTNITGTWNSATGIMNLTGTATLVEYQTALRSIRYANTSDDPVTSIRNEETAKTARLITATPRTVSFTLFDGTNNSNTQTRDLKISSVNDAPVVTTNTGVTVDEGAEAQINNSMLQVSDVDGNTLSVRYYVTQKPAHGEMNKDVFTQNDLNNGGITYVHDGSETTEDSFVFYVMDGEGAVSGNVTFAITVNPIADPVNQPSNVNYSYSETGNIVLTWEDNSNNENGFDVWRRQSSNARARIINEFIKIATLPAGSESFVDENVNEGENYIYRVTAFNEEVPSPITEGDDEGEIIAAAPLSTPTFLNADDNGDLTIRVTWEDNSLIEAGYQLERKVDVDWTNLIILEANTTAYIDNDIAEGIEYYYRVKAIGNDNESIYSNESSAMCTLTGIDDWTDGIPTEFTLYQNYPNPFNPSTTITYGLPEASNVRLVVYNILGQEVALLVNQILSAGYHEITFNVEGLNSGIYIYKITAGSFTEVRKMILLK